MNALKTLHKDKLLQVTKNQKKDILYLTWTNQCTNVLKEDLKGRLDAINKILQKHHPTRILINLYFCDYFIEPDNYRWYEKTMFSIIDLDKQVRLAIVVPQNLFVHASFEATRIALEKEKLPVQYFIDSEKAEHWLMIA
ncbi:MAG: hypothetical protein ACOC2F_02110 [Bacteroidota bacterium]